MQRNIATSISVRAFAASDDLEALTALIRAAYAKRAAVNLKYWATYQTSADTAKRLKSGHGLIAEIDSEVVGTLLVRPPQPDSEVPQFRDPFTWTLAQFAVSPVFQGRGVGRKLHQAALAHVKSNGGRTLALDTAAPAADLIEMYLRWGYSVVGECDWRPQTNYLSVVMSRPIDAQET